ncbi:MAG: acetylxylan esterase [Acidobacteriota bacterium]|nr:acetylxylan esterase [Acidobacteriota bacterium]
MVRWPFLLALSAVAALAQQIPDPLTLSDGSKVHDAKTWNEKRRPELLAIFSDRVYGKTPSAAIPLRLSQVLVDPNALGGKAIRKQVTLYFTLENAGPRMHLLIYLPPKPVGRVPVFLGLNFNGNQSVAKDKGILENDVWLKERLTDKWIHLPPDDRNLGEDAANWQIEKILSHGYGLVTAYYFDLEPDFSGGMKDGIRPLFPDPEQWSAMGAWAWGISRAVDYLRTDRNIDPSHIAVIGHSRLGKAALWAAAQDPRISLVVSNESGKGGASLLKHHAGETIDHLNTAFPYWFGPNYKQYTGHPDNLPVDANELLALIAPRPLYVASADGDPYSDPRGEFLSAANVGKVYALFGEKGLGTYQMPPLNQPIMHDVGYHIRSGRHDVTDYDWDQYLAFADLHWEKR